MSLFIGGGMVFTFLKAQGIPIGNSLCEEAEVIRSPKIHLPVDLVIANGFSNDAKRK